MGWRRVTETAKQKWGLSLEKNFKATSNARNEAMFREATKFAGYLRIVEKDLQTWQREVEATFGNLRSIMLSPLPRVYEEGHNGVAVPCEPEPTMIGGNVQVERLTTAAQDLKKRLETEVIQPIKQWMVAYRTIQERMKRLEALRLELDSRRRTVSALQGKCERLRANLGTTKAKGEADMEITMRRMQHKDDKMHRTHAQFQEVELTVYNSLFTLIKDTSVLREYAAAAVLIMQEGFSAGYVAFEPSIAQYSSNGAVFTDNKYDPRAEIDPTHEHEVTVGLEKISLKGGSASPMVGKARPKTGEYPPVPGEGDTNMTKAFDQSYEYGNTPTGGTSNAYQQAGTNRYWAQPAY